MEIPFIGGAYTGRSLNLDAQVCQNLMPVVDKEGGRILALMNTPGAKLWLESGVSGTVRGMTVWGDYLYFVVNNTLLKTDINRNVTSISTSISSGRGKIWFAGGVSYLMLVDGANGWYTDGSILTQITDTEFPVPTSLTYQDGFFIVTKKDTDNIYISASEDPSSWAALDFESAEVQPDKAFVVISNDKNLWILGKPTSEVHYNSGDSDFPFTQIAGASMKVGCGAPDSASVGPEGMFWLDHLYRVVTASGYEAVPVSTAQIDYQISLLSGKSSAIGYSYTQEGHSFYVLTFPDKTLVYDITTGFWHSRASNISGGRHCGNCYAWFADKHLVGHFSDGRIYELDFDTYNDAGVTRKWIRSAQAIHKDRKRIFHNSLEIEFEAGVGLVTGQGSDPVVMLDWSDDGGHTWSNEHWTRIGKIGEYNKRARWNKLGQSRNRIYRVSGTDPVKIVIVGANLEAKLGSA